MIDHKLANVLLKVAPHAADHPGLFWRNRRELSFDESRGALGLRGETDFLTYLNALSASKWRRYCGLDAVWLHVRLSGDAGRLKVVGTPERGIDESVAYARRFDASETPCDLEFEIDCKGRGLVSFAIFSEGTTYLHEAWYSAKVDEGRVRPIRLAASTTTFRKESYVIPNIEKVKTGVADPSDPIFGNFHMFVVDNGQTLDARALSDDVVSVLPNRNAGGAGGFARGMLEVTAPGADFTHVILMDDDVVVFPESIKRTFNLLSLANDRYADAFVNGAMMSLSEPNRQFEDVAHVRRSGGYVKVKPDLYVDELGAAARNEQMDVEVPLAYGAWWFSCIPVAAIREHGLPLPVFVRCDDVEYGVRCHPTYMTMNGICVWHESFESKPRASVDCYQYVRNFLTLIACDHVANEDLFLERIWRSVHLRLRDLEYGAAELLLDGIEDYLKGPEFLASADGAQIMREKSAKNERYVPIGEADPAIIAAAHLDQVRPTEHRRASVISKLVQTLPYDKHLLPDALLRDEPGHFRLTSGSTFDRDTFCRKTIVVIDSAGENVAVRTMDRERRGAIVRRMAELRREHARRRHEVARQWAEAFPRLTSKEFWRDYLRLE